MPNNRGRPIENLNNKKILMNMMTMMMTMNLEKKVLLHKKTLIALRKN